MKQLISIIISTKNRPDQLSRCLESIRKQNFISYNLIVIDQNINKLTQYVCKNSGIINLIYLNHPYGWKTVALNAGLQYANTKYVAFTDDDCIPDANWLKNIISFFLNNPTSVGVFGRVIPFGKPPNNQATTISTINLPERHTITKPDPFLFSKLGNGNNMAFSKKIFRTVGEFNKWLGVGSPCGGGGEDGELAYRILRKGYPLTYEPSILVHHNRWLSAKEFLRIQSTYSCGSNAFTTYSLLKDGDIRLVNNYLLCAKYAFGQIFNAFQNRRIPFTQILNAFRLLHQSTKGVVIGIIITIDSLIGYRIINAFIFTKPLIQNISNHIYQKLK